MEVIILNLKIATRRSRLAQIQTELVIKMLGSRFKVQCEKLLMQTEGDKKIDISLDKIGGKGLFVKDIEMALLNGFADAAVHSMKDVPFDLESEFEIASVPARGDVRDVFVSADETSFFNLPEGAKIGTSSNRRCAQVKLMRPDIETIPIRGNVETRIRKMKEQGMDGIVLAAAGLKRLGLEEVITEYFDPLSFLPAVGQGALGIEVLKNSTNSEMFRKLDDENIRICIEAERSFMRRLNGGCHTSLGAYSILDGEKLYLKGIFEVGGRLVKKDIIGSKYDNIKLGEDLAEKILND
jgi:hydroxymethylbilane synthase